ncbi:MAG: hypothetical protein K2N26_01335, partial [Oscillospiraceae bacterium]|nr:hypothetical protein [Oscillospiraceae bacterium]
LILLCKLKYYKSIQYLFVICFLPSSSTVSIVFSQTPSFFSISLAEAMLSSSQVTSTLSK